MKLPNMLCGESDAHVLVAVVLTSRHVPRIAALSHVVLRIDSYTNCIETKWTLEKASERRLVNLMGRFGKLEWPGVDYEFRKKRFLIAAIKAAKECSFQTLQWWMTEYLPDHDFAISEIRRCLIQGDGLIKARIEILEWMLQQEKLTIGSQESPFEVTDDYNELVPWLHENVSGIRMKLLVTDESSLEYVQWAIAHQGRYEIEGIADFMHEVVRHGYPDCLPWLFEVSPERLPCDHFRSMHKVYNVDYFKLPYEAYPKQYFDDPTLSSSCLRVIKWFLTVYDWKNENARLQWIEKCIEAAAFYPYRLDIIEFLYSVCPGTGTGEAMENAAFKGCFDTVKVLHAHQANPKGSMDLAAASGHIAILQWLHEHETDGCTTTAMDRAASENHLSVVQWLHANRSEGCTTKAMDRALLKGHFKLVQWLHKNRTEGYNPQIMDRLAANGHLELVQWLHQNRSEGCTFNAMDEAAANGHLMVVQFLHNHRTEGCTTAAMDKAARGGHLDVVQWLHENRHEGCTTDAMDGAATCGHFEVIQYLHKNRTEGCTIGAVNRALGWSSWHVEIVKWLFDNLPELNTAEAIASVMEKAANRGDLRLVLWILPKASACAIVEALKIAIAMEHVELQRN